MVKCYFYAPCCQVTIGFPKRGRLIHFLSKTLYFIINLAARKEPDPEDVTGHVPGDPVAPVRFFQLATKVDLNEY